MKYKLVHGEDEDELTERVNAAIQEGWAPQGGVIALINTFSKNHYPYRGGEIEVWEPHIDEWHQSMVITEPDDSDTQSVSVDRITVSELNQKLGR